MLLKNWMNLQMNHIRQGEQKYKPSKFEYCYASTITNECTYSFHNFRSPGKTTPESQSIVGGILDSIVEEITQPPNAHIQRILDDIINNVVKPVEEVVASKSKPILVETSPEIAKKAVKRSKHEAFSRSGYVKKRRKSKSVTSPKHNNDGSSESEVSDF